MNYKYYFLFSLTVLASCLDSKRFDATNSIKPYIKNPEYWQYKEEPVLLLGATNNDNLFQSSDMVEQLDLLVENGGNYIRNTMSSRDTGDLWPFKLRPDGLYDLNSWNDEYWNRFLRLLEAANDRDVIIQIEIWDRFDYSRKPWQMNPFNPAINVNYDTLIGLSTDYPKHPSSDEQPFFHSIPGMPRYRQSMDEVRVYQERLLDKILGYTLNYGNILYCMNNETSTPKEWGLYWMKFISEKAKQAGREVYVTDMFDHYFRPNSCELCKYEINNPELYKFVDVSQINSRNFGQMHWDSLKWIMEYRDQIDPVRPVNCVKTYGGGNSSWGSGSNQDGVERLVRQVLLGVAAGRHHRRPSGNGNNEMALSSLRSIRKIEGMVKFWELEPAMDILEDREANEAYAARSRNGKDHYVIYFPLKGTVTLSLSGNIDQYDVNWIDIRTGQDHDVDWTGKEKMISVSSLSDTGGFYVVSMID